MDGWMDECNSWTSSLLILSYKYPCCLADMSHRIRVWLSVLNLKAKGEGTMKAGVLDRSCRVAYNFVAC
jgi:hypothetical protein